jgi:1-acyl-sn-glycerol-3-phosphate acyltransferase
MIAYGLVWSTGLIVVGRDPARRSRWRARMFRSWSAAILKVIGLRFEISGVAPQAPFYLVSNHLGYLDILVLASQLDAVFVAKAEVADWPVLGPLCKSMDTIFIDRSLRRDISRVLDETREALERGDGVVVFPEGTSTGGDEVRRFLPSLLATPANLRQPVHFATLAYSTPEGEPPARRAVCWWDNMTFPDHFWRLMGLSRVDVRVVFGDRAITHQDRKQLAAELWHGILHDFEPMVGLTSQ